MARGGRPQAPLDWGDEEAATRVNRDFACLSLLAGEGPLSGRVFGSDGDPLTIGRGAGCAVQLPLSEISRRHARIRYQAGRFWVDDLQTLNGTWLNDHLIDRPTPLKNGDRLRIGTQVFEVRHELHVNREVVQDSLVDEDERHARPPVEAQVAAWLRLGGLTVLVVLGAALMTVVVIRFAMRSGSREPTVIAAPPAVPSPSPSGAVPASPSAAQSPAPSSGIVVAPALPPRLEADGLVVVTASEDGVVQRALPRGVTLHAGDEVVRVRHRDNGKQRELDQLNARLEDDENNEELAQRARELAAEVAEAPKPVTLRSALDGVLVGVAMVGTRLHAGDEAFRVARALRLVDARIAGSGDKCRIQLIAQDLELKGKRAGAVIEVTQFPAQLSLDRLGPIRVSCD